MQELFDFCFSPEFKKGEKNVGIWLLMIQTFYNRHSHRY